MPYIDQDTRGEIAENGLVELCEYLSQFQLRDNPGLFNYVVCKILLEGLPPLDDVHYVDVNALKGVLACVSAEFQEKVINPYERKKEDENGPVFI